MILKKKTIQTQVADLEKKAQGEIKKSKDKMALTTLKKAYTLGADFLGIQTLEQLLNLHEKFESVWEESDFILHTDLVMRLQEIRQPKLKRVHASFTPEWKEVSGLIQKVLKSGNQEEENRLVEEIVSHGDQALYPLIETLLAFRDLGRK